ncbi:MAG: serine hydrolase domain-containing protein [Nitrospiria bacterium]
MNDLIEEKIQEGIQKKVFPGCVLLIHTAGKIVFHKAFGSSIVTPLRSKMYLNTLFDIASLTKPLATTTAIAFLLQEKQLSLGHQLHQIIPSFSGEGKKDITLFHLLNHASGLPAWKPYFEVIAARDAREAGFLGSPEAKQAVYDMAHQEALIAPPGQKNCYSDIGFILLGEVVETVSGLSLDAFFRKYLFTHLASEQPFFQPHAVLQNDATSFAATQDSAWRKEVIQGRVDDDNAYVMGGVAGHAGLFSSALGVYQLVCLWTHSIEGQGFLSPAIASQFVERQVDEGVPRSSSRGLGWDTPSYPSSSGRYFSSESFGHLGFTGTSVWVDRKNDLIVIFLSNRVHPLRANEQIHAFRPELHDLIFEEFVR